MVEASSQVRKSTIDNRVIWASVTMVSGSGCIVDLTWIEKGAVRDDVGKTFAGLIDVIYFIDT